MKRLYDQFILISHVLMCWSEGIDNGCRCVSSWKRRNQSMLEIWNRVTMLPICWRRIENVLSRR